MKKNGAKVDFGKKLVKFPVNMVEDVLRYIPQRVVLYNHRKEPTVTLGERKSYLFNGHNAPCVLNLGTHQRRKALKRNGEDFGGLDTFSHPDASDGTPCRKLL